MTAGRLVSHLEALLAGIAVSLEDGGEAPLAGLPLLTAAERQQLREWNDTAVEPAAAELCLHDLVAAQIARTPDALAVSCGGATLTYRQLGAATGALAARLRRLGVSTIAQLAAMALSLSSRWASFIPTRVIRKTTRPA